MSDNQRPHLTDTQIEDRMQSAEGKGPTQKLPAQGSTVSHR